MLWEWLANPIDPTRAHEVGFLLAWHARLMTLAWAVLVPLGIVVARYFKVMPGQRWPEQLDNKAWWVAHRALQYGAVLLMLAGLALILAEAKSHAGAAAHRLMGYGMLALAVVQVLGGQFRGSKGGPNDLGADGSLRGDHYDMTPRRRVFEYLHKTAGYVGVLLAVPVTVTGLWIANAPNWMWVTLVLWWGALTAVCVALQRRGMALDTYQAIWGPDPDLPGNRIAPIGIGIVRRPPPALAENASRKLT